MMELTSPTIVLGIEVADEAPIQIFVLASFFLVLLVQLLFDSEVILNFAFTR